MYPNFTTCFGKSCPGPGPPLMTNWACEELTWGLTSSYDITHAWLPAHAYIIVAQACHGPPRVQKNTHSHSDNWDWVQEWQHLWTDLWRTGFLKNRIQGTRTCDLTYISKDNLRVWQPCRSLGKNDKRVGIGTSKKVVCVLFSGE